MACLRAGVGRAGSSSPSFKAFLFQPWLFFSPLLLTVLAVTLWTIGTYFFPLFNAYPYLYFGGIKRTGKTKALTLLKLLSLNAIFSTNISTSSLFRLIQSGRCTLLMDESESLSNAERKQDLRSLILAGYKRAATVWRTEKNAAERLVPESFEVYSPKALANIAGLEDTLEDRCISIIMQRGRDRAILNSEPDERDPVWQETRDELHVLALKFWREIASLTSEVSVVSEEVKIGVKGASEKYRTLRLTLGIWRFGSRSLRLRNSSINTCLPKLKILIKMYPWRLTTLLHKLHKLH
jgi:hypothetical protein